MAIKYSDKKKQRGNSIKNENFFFGSLDSKDKKTALLFVKKSTTNLFFTVADLKKNAIITFTSGSTLERPTKKQKRSPYIVESVFKKILFYLKLYEVQVIRLFLKLRLNISHVHVLVKELNYYGISVLSINEMKGIPHNGVKIKRRPRK